MRVVVETQMQRESSFLSSASCVALPTLRVTSICQGTLCDSNSPKSSLFFSFALLFQELLFKDEAKLKAGCSIDCVLFLFPFLSLPISSLAIYSLLTSGLPSLYWQRLTVDSAGAAVTHRFWAILQNFFFFF